MDDALEVINKAIEQHHKIREHLAQTGDSMTDIEALFMLNKMLANWSQSSIREYQDRRVQLLKAVKALERGLKRHFEYEEKFLPPLLGEVLMKTIIGDHQKIAGLIKKAKDEIAGARGEGLNQTELLAGKTKIQGDIQNIIEAAEKHAGHEETILTSIKKAMEDTAVK
jgi:hypothetical protein